MDLTATILAATGTVVPPAARPEGHDLVPILEGRAPPMERVLFWRTSVGGRRQKAVRKGEWKLVIDGTHTLVFNVRSDVAEREDLASRRPDIARELWRLLVAWEQDVDAEAKENR